MKKLILLGVVCTAVFVLCGCKERGVGQRTGSAIDNAADQGVGQRTGSAIDNAVDQARESTGDAAASAGKAVQDAIK